MKGIQSQVEGNVINQVEGLLAPRECLLNKM